MRARFQRYWPIFLVALLVQFLAPIAASSAAAVAASDPLSVAEICHAGGANQPIDKGGQFGGHGSGCSICCLTCASSAIDTPTLLSFAVPYGEPARFVWRDQTADLSVFRVASNAQARGPPFSS
jgi:Protein of unknown function (DUF2946)